MASELLEQTAFLHLLFEYPQSKVDIVVLHFDDYHESTSDVARGRRSSRGFAGLTVMVGPSSSLWLRLAMASWARLALWMSASSQRITRPSRAAYDCPSADVD